MKRQIIKIDDEKCTGCGLCIPGCPEGAIQLIDGKARLISDLFCDGLGACIGDCPEGAIEVIEREAEPYDEVRVMQNIVKQGPNTIKAHLKHLLDHQQDEFYQQAITYLKEHNMPIPEMEAKAPACGGGCPGSQSMSFEDETAQPQAPSAPQPAAPQPIAPQASALSHWPVQMHLIAPQAPHFKESDLVLAADCVGFSLGDFHQTWLKGKTVAIACPKLDSNQDVYLNKLVGLIDDAKINTLTVMIMQVPCCGGLLHLAQAAREQASRNIPIKAVVVSVRGEILRQEWI